MKETKAQTKNRANKIFKTLSKTYPDAHCALNYDTPFQLLIATILSAQSTDKQINKLTPELFSKYKNPSDFAKAKQIDVETLVHSSGFFRNKAKNIIAASKMIERDFADVMPKNMDDLIKLPGVARKTANVVLFNAYGINEGIAVDTHVMRLSKRLSVTKKQDPKDIEKDLMLLFPQKSWGMVTHYLIDHGRAICEAKKPKCNICEIAKYCPCRGAPMWVPNMKS